ncbi:hypothetical protein L484_016654 [Morus notabilis]|uniref:Uncharacterized protein n=1 Tax=Morus notabilis TaxID=981085 RepID=W9RUT1_9ROSA|nr:hypothetical protein L484_016654 [Morus notabilis]
MAHVAFEKITLNQSASFFCHGRPKSEPASPLITAPIVIECMNILASTDQQLATAKEEGPKGEEL